MKTEILDLKVVRVHRLPEGPLKAFVDMSVNDLLLIKGIKLVHGQKGLFVSLPQEQGKDKRWYNIIHCLSQELRSEITTKVIAAYESAA